MKYMINKSCITREKLLKRVRNYFFEPISPCSLGIVRIIIFGLLFWKSLSHRWVLIADWPTEFITRTAVRELPYLTKTGLLSLTIILAVFSFLGLLGIFTRWAAAVCFIVLYLFNGVDGGAYDSGWLPFSFLLLMTCCKSEDFLSIKQIWRHQSSSLPCWEYRWPLRVMQLSFILIYFENGFSKLWYSGLNWIKPEVLQDWYLFHLWTDTFYLGLGKIFAEYPLLATLSNITTLILENGVIFVLFNEKLKWIFIPNLFMMHLAIGLAFDIWFKEYFFLLLVFFDSSAILKALVNSLQRNQRR